MSLIIRNGNKKFEIKLPEDACNKLFEYLVIKATQSQARVENELSKNAPVIPVKSELTKTVPALTAEKIVPAEVVREVSTSYHTEQPVGYKGSLVVRCEHCGKVKVFGTKDRIKNFVCSDCGAMSVLGDHLPKMRVDCTECGNHWWYTTNLEGEPIDVNCYTCGSLVAMKYNAKTHMYDPM